MSCEPVLELEPNEYRRYLEVRKVISRYRQEGFPGGYTLGDPCFPSDPRPPVPTPRAGWLLLGLGKYRKQKEH